MSDRYAGRIFIGGVLPVWKLATLAKVVTTEDSDIQMNWSLRNNGIPTVITTALLRDWLRHRSNPEPLHLYACELIDGSFPALENWLSANEMSYLRHSDAYLDIEAEIAGFVDGKRVRYDANNDGDVMIRAERVQRVYDALRNGRVFDAMDVLSAIVPIVTEVSPFMVQYANGKRL